MATVNKRNTNKEATKNDKYSIENMRVVDNCGKTLAFFTLDVLGVKIYNFLYKEFNICSFVEANANKKDHELKCVISFLVKEESNNSKEPQYEINLPALLISFSKCFSFLL